MYNTLEYLGRLKLISKMIGLSHRVMIKVLLCEPCASRSYGVLHFFKVTKEQQHTGMGVTGGKNLSVIDKSDRSRKRVVSYKEHSLREIFKPFEIYTPVVEDNQQEAKTF